MTISQAARALRAGQVSSSELTQASLARIHAWNPRLNAMIAVLEDSALSLARTADEQLRAGTDMGPLHGIPIAVKDVFRTRGVRTTV